MFDLLLDDLQAGDTNYTIKKMLIFHKVVQ